MTCRTADLPDVGSGIGLACVAGPGVGDAERETSPKVNEPVDMRAFDPSTVRTRLRGGSRRPDGSHSRLRDASPAQLRFNRAIVAATIGALVVIGAAMWLSRSHRRRVGTRRRRTGNANNCRLILA